MQSGKVFVHKIAPACVRQQQCDRIAKSMLFEHLYIILIQCAADVLLLFTFCKYRSEISYSLHSFSILDQELT
jgi:hypothetical protein